MSYLIATPSLELCFLPQIALPLGVTSFIKSIKEHASKNIQSGECKEQQQKQYSGSLGTRTFAKNAVAVTEDAM